MTRPILEETLTFHLTLICENSGEQVDEIASTATDAVAAAMHHLVVQSGRGRVLADITSREGLLWLLTWDISSKCADEIATEVADLGKSLVAALLGGPA